MEQRAADGLRCEAVCKDCHHVDVLLKLGVLESFCLVLDIIILIRSALLNVL